jgi:hypothetical protein
MKKSTCASILFVIISTGASLVSFGQKGFHAGVQGAPLLSVTFNGDDAKNEGMDYKAKRSRTVGVTGSYFFNDKMGIGLELMYSKENQRYEDALVSYKQKFQYLKVPVVFHYNSNPDAALMFTAKAGPQLGVLLGADISDASNAALNGSSKDKYNKIHLGAMAGVGASLRVTEAIRVNAGLRFDGSITNLEDRDHKEFQPGRVDSHYLNAGIEVGVHYNFGR